MSGVDQHPSVLLRLIGEDGNFRLDIQRNCDVPMAQAIVARANVGLSEAMQQLLEQVTTQEPGDNGNGNGTHDKPVHLYVPNSFRR